MNTPTTSSTAPARRRKTAKASLGDRWCTQWESLAPRERKAAALAAWVVGLALLWWVALDAQLAKMQTLAATVVQLRGQNRAPTPSRGAAQSALEQATRQLGATAQVNIQGDKAILTLRGTPPQDLAVWLNQVRVNARLVPVHAQLERGSNPDGWRGQITVAGPGLGGTSP
jgi:general secretion pathway protein M